VLERERERKGGKERERERERRERQGGGRERRNACEDASGKKISFLIFFVQKCQKSRPLVSKCNF